jgi:hypothetical protein
LIGTVACDRGHDRTASSATVSPQDSVALAREFSASLAGDVSPGGQNYSYRGLYAGMTREHLESSVRDTASHCERVDKPAGVLCHYEVTLRPDSARVTIDATYVVSSGDTTAIDIDVERPLPLDVDGVALARRLADAFEQQTRLLDKRDATFEGRTAKVRMGTMSGERQNFVDIVVGPKSGRDMLSVHLRRPTQPSGEKVTRKAAKS